MIVVVLAGESVGLPRQQFIHSLLRDASSIVACRVEHGPISSRCSCFHWMASPCVRFGFNEAKIVHDVACPICSENYTLVCMSCMVPQNISATYCCCVWHWLVCPDFRACTFCLWIKRCPNLYPQFCHGVAFDATEAVSLARCVKSYLLSCGCA